MLESSGQLAQAAFCHPVARPQPFQHTSSAGTPPSSATIFLKAATVPRMGTARPTRRNRWLLEGKTKVTLKNLENTKGAKSLKD